MIFITVALQIPENFGSGIMNDSRFTPEELNSTSGSGFHPE